MFKISLVTLAVCALTISQISAAQAYTFRPGATPSGGRIGKYCNTDLLSDAEQKDCVKRLKEAKTDEDRREIVNTLRETMKARQKEADAESERLNPGGKNGLACTGQQCQ